MKILSCFSFSALKYKRDEFYQKVFRCDVNPTILLLQLTVKATTLKVIKIDTIKH